jgi:hypothetical protein
MSSKNIANEKIPTQVESQTQRQGVPSLRRPSPEEIRRRAFEIHIERGGIHGCDLDDWLQAERELENRAHKRNAIAEERRT